MLGQYKNANGKYKNAYTTSYVARNGDAIGETAGWHGSGASRWLLSEAAMDDSGLLRAYSGSVFSYYGISHYNGGNDYYCATYTRAWSTRACIVVGTGF